MIVCFQILLMGFEWSKWLGWLELSLLLEKCDLLVSYSAPEVEEKVEEQSINYADD